MAMVKKWAHIDFSQGLIVFVFCSHGTGHWELMAHLLSSIRIEKIRIPVFLMHLDSQGQKLNVFRNPEKSLSAKNRAPYGQHASI